MRAQAPRAGDGSVRRSASIAGKWIDSATSRCRAANVH